MARVAVLGCGVVGVSTAVNIQSTVPGAHVTLIGDKFYSDTTSDGAAGIFAPTLTRTPAVSESTFRQWCEESFRWYDGLYRSAEGAEAGVEQVSGRQLNDQHNQPLYFHDIVYDYRQMTQKEMDLLPVRRKYGWFITTLMVECRRYLPWLMRRFRESGGHVIQKTVESLDEFIGRYDVVVNCLGLGSQKLFNDQEMFPVRGHLLRVQAPWIKHFLMDGDFTYIYPGQDNVVLGGTREKGVYNTVPDPGASQGIVARCSEHEPSLTNAHIEQEWIGFRPYRTLLRLETEVRPVGGAFLKVVHNYGHGSNGVALSWGTAVEAAKLVQSLLNNPYNKSKVVSRL